VVPLGQVSVLASSGSAVVVVADAVQQATFMLPYFDCGGGYRIEGQDFTNHYRSNVLYIPCALAPSMPHPCFVGAVPVNSD
jgi:hypothetical protein